MSPPETRKLRCPTATARSLPRRAFPGTMVDSLVQTSATFMSEAGTRFNVERSTSNDELQDRGSSCLGFTDRLHKLDAGFRPTHTPPTERRGGGVFSAWSPHRRLPSRLRR